MTEESDNSPERKRSKPCMFNDKDFNYINSKGHSWYSRVVHEKIEEEKTKDLSESERVDKEILDNEKQHNELILKREQLRQTKDEQGSEINKLSKLVKEARDKHNKYVDSLGEKSRYAIKEEVRDEVKHVIAIIQGDSGAFSSKEILAEIEKQQKEEVEEENRRKKKQEEAVIE